MRHSIFSSIVPFATLLLLAGSACSSADSDARATDDAADRRGSDAVTTLDPRPCSSAVIPNRLGLAWKELNHRYSVLDLQLGETSSEDCLPERLQTEFIGGPYSGSSGSSGSGGIDDTPILEYGFQTRDSTGEPDVAFVRRNFKRTFEASSDLEETRTYTRESLQLRGYENVVAVIEGFRIDTDVEQVEDYPEDYDPAHGYTVHGLGASVDVTTVTDGEIDLHYRLRFEPGPSPDREDLNRAVEHARVSARLDILLIGLSEAPTTSGSVDYRVEYPEPKVGEDDDFPPPPEQKRRIVLEGTPDRPRGFWGIGAFDFELSPRIDCTSDRDCPASERCLETGRCTDDLGEPGFYLRELSVDIALEEYDRAEGTAAFLFDGYASNATNLVGFWPMRSDFTGTVRWIQAENASPQIRYESEFETGRADFALDEMRE